MFFRRNEGEYRETDRVTRFKLIKSGKQWLRAATSNFGLFKVVKGGADAPSVSAQSVEEKTPLLSGHCTHKMRHKKTLLLKSGKLETGVFCYGQKSIFSRN